MNRKRLRLPAASLLAAAGLTAGGCVSSPDIYALSGQIADVQRKVA